MDTTRKTLLARVRDPQDQEAWAEFFDLYAPLLMRYAQALGLSRDQAEEIQGECLEVVARKMRSFEYDRARGAFKAFLFRLVRGKVIDQLRKRRETRAHSEALARLCDPDLPPDEQWNRHWEYEHLRYCLELVRPTVPEPSYRAFRMLLFDEQSVADVCRALDLNANQVYKAKSTILQKVRAVLRRLGAEELGAPGPDLSNADSPSPEPHDSP